MESFNERSIDGKIIVVTGASRGLGRHLALRLAQRKAILVLTARDIDQLNTTVEELKKETNHSAIYGFQCDQGKRESIDQFYAQFAQQFDHIDFLVNNASIMPGYAMEEIDDELDEQTYRVNVEGMHFVTKRALPFLFKPQNEADAFERGVIFVSSSASWLEEPEEGYGMISYRASKAAENGIMVGLHQLYVDDNQMAKNLRGDRKLSRVASVHPGFVATGLGRETWQDKTHDDATIASLKSGFGAIDLDSGIDTALWLIASENGVVQSGKHYYQRKVHSF